MRKFEHIAALKQWNAASWITRKHKAINLAEKDSWKVLDELFK
jgi:hypothetical protein